MTILAQEIWTKNDFVDLARRQKQFLLVFLVILLANIAWTAVPAVRDSAGRFLSIGLSIAGLYVVYQLMVAVLPASSTWMIVAYFVLSLFPLVNLLLLGYLNTLASSRLRLSGVRAGFLGASIASVEALPDETSVTIDA